MSPKFNTEELRQIRAALADRRFETERYLKTNRITNHDECCPTRIAHERMAEEYNRGLTERMNSVLSALDKAEAALPTEDEQEPTR